MNAAIVTAIVDVVGASGVRSTNYPVPAATEYITEDRGALMGAVLLLVLARRHAARLLGAARRKSAGLLGEAGRCAVAGALVTRIVIATAVVHCAGVAMAIVAAVMMAVVPARLGLPLLVLLAMPLALRLGGTGAGEDQGRSRDACQTMKRNSHIDLLTKGSDGAVGAATACAVSHCILRAETGESP